MSPIDFDGIDPAVREIEQTIGPISNQGWLWRGKESAWISVRDAGITPGMTILVSLSAGGYSEEAGWTGNPANNKHRSRYQPQAEPPDEDLLSCLEHGWRSITVHTAEVSEERLIFKIALQGCTESVFALIRSERYSCDFPLPPTTWMFLAS